MSRLDDLRQLYAILGELDQRLGGARTLSANDSLAGLPQRGVYFFFEPGEPRSQSGDGLRVVRIGTHGLAAGSQSTLRQRLAQHRGRSSAGGNHRGSIFRLLLGEALLERDGLRPCESWGIKGDLKKASDALNRDAREIADIELPIETAVSIYVRQMPFLWLNIDDEPGPETGRSMIERNCIALLSSYQRDVLDPPSPTWLGRKSNRKKVRDSGLWNQRHVEEEPDPQFLGALRAYVLAAKDAR